MARPRPKSPKLTPEEIQKLDEDFLLRIKVNGKRDKASYYLWTAFFTSPVWLVPVLDGLAHLGGYIAGSSKVESKLEMGLAELLVLYLFFVAFWIGRKTAIDQFFNKAPKERMGSAPESWSWLLDRFYPYPSDRQANVPLGPQKQK